MVLAVRTPPGDQVLAAALRAGRFFRRALPHLAGVRVEMGPRAAGAIEVLVDVAPAAMAAASAGGLPLRFSAGSVDLAGSRYTAPGQAAAARQPAAPKPTWLVVGVDADGAAALADRLLFELAEAAGGFGGPPPAAAGPPALGFDFLVRQAPGLERRGSWRPGGAGGAFTADPAGERDDLQAWRDVAARLRELPGENVTLLVPGSGSAGPARTEMATLAAALDTAAAEMAPRLPVHHLARPDAGRLAVAIVVAVEDDFVAQARHTGAIGEAVPAGVPDDRAELHLVYHPADLFAYRFAIAGRLIERAGLAGPSAAAGVRAGPAERSRRLPPWLERGAALWLAGDWYGRPFRDWLPWLAGAAVLPSAAELLAPEIPPEGSTVLWTPVAAALLDQLPGVTLSAKLDGARRLTAGEVDAWLGGLAAAVGTTGTAARTSGNTGTPEAMETTGSEGTTGTTGATATADADAASAARRVERLGRLPLRGVSLAMENSLEGGYHAPALDRQIDRLAALGVDAVSLMPFAYQEGPASPRLRMLNASPESETDVGLIHAVRRARAHGMRTLYKPHIWVGGGSWPGDIAMRDEAAWTAWWRDYRRYLLHHAVLASWAGADLFSIGCELSGTLGRAEDWRRTIAAARAVFPGVLTYAGNWSGDLEGAPFWQQLDLIGVDAYYPLSPNPAAGTAELARGAAAVAAHLAAASRARQRQLLLTEVGFASSRAAWTAPHKEGGVPSQADQAACYTALFAALGRPGWLAGTFVWKAFSGELEDRGRRRRGEERAADFRFLGREAEAAIAAYYLRGPGASRPSGR
jgi:hypothetical protein